MNRAQHAARFRFRRRSGLEVEIDLPAVRYTAAALREHGPAFLGFLLRTSFALLFAASWQQSLPAIERLSGASVPVMDAVVACSVLTVERYSALLFTVFLAGVIEDVFCPSVGFGLSSLTYVLLAFALRTLKDYPATRTPRDTLCVGVLVCLGSAVVHWIAAMCSGGGEFCGGMSALGQTAGMAFLGGLIATPLLLRAMAFGRWFGVAVWEFASALSAFTVAYFLRRIKPPAVGSFDAVLPPNP